ncbi:MAG: hypothetical protein Q8N18_18800 [Opitutaceae bacterium]|nr:hypothetical protein [Opitutaceae bacterium]
MKKMSSQPDTFLLLSASHEERSHSVGVKFMCAKKKQKVKRVRGASVLARNPHIKTGGGGSLDVNKRAGRAKVAAAKLIKKQLDALSD